MYASSFFYPLRATTPYSLHINIVCMYVCIMVITFTSSRSCSWLAEQGKWIFPCPRSRLRIWSYETGSAVPSRVSLLILHAQAESGAYSRDSSQFPRWRPFLYLNRHMPSGQSRVYWVAQLRTDGVSLPRVCRHRASSLQDIGRCLCITMEQLMCVSLFPHPLLV